MPDFHTEIRNKKLQDIKHERFLMRYDIWSGVIWGFLGGANEIWALLGVCRRFETTYSSRNIRTKLPNYVAQNSISAGLEIYWLCSLHNCITWYPVVKKLSLTTEDWQTNTQFRSFPLTNPAVPRTGTAGSNLQMEVASAFFFKFADPCLLHKTHLVNFLAFHSTGCHLP